MDENTRGGKEGSNNGGNIKKRNKNIIKNLQDRELSCKHHRAFVTATTPHRFQNMRFSHELDTHHSKHKSPPHILPFLMGRTKIVQITAAKNIVFVLAESGLCAAFSSETDERICFMNLHPNDLIRRLFYNKNNDSLITASSRSRMPEEYRSTRIEDIRRAKPDAGFDLFQSESFVVKFDDVNAKVLTYSAQDSIFKVFDLKNYTFLYLFSFSNVDWINISSGIMLFIFKRTSDHIPVKIISIEDGKVLKQFNCLH
ncbi:putative WD40/YVTN repeat-like-containing domain-containing protein [Medicago truncatula]|uniref:Putative WD40/YVTN repeat-like-containing domain-containing protein n=1 Tax=Medicago truncatula TaxID=3880 RepID=A0A396ICP2_MEDTR|nr:putative WD40/YVTN repeat-like-containing domain-containing protein [Medicago truncatula]